ncbi:hypothetical protein HNR23_002483 [Nocardiopsis mwathae]|uniref:DUF397 domain-containing protein n=1 Tax=Nocardiopsis mwathae TaxID=1472723 RepID=A0A7W9YHV4_9ACTN|nr:DUF397 domain-containing protein [Nocardiopsis mwathae]MBB6172423.1 hypothetical protein [Nocardiopsis mwathae]
MSTDSAVVSEGAGRGESACTSGAERAEKVPPVRSWWKSSYSNDGEGCLEVSRTSRPIVLIRDSTDPLGTVIGIGVDAWQEFLSGLRMGDFGAAD